MARFWEENGFTLYEAETKLLPKDIADEAKQCNVMLVKTDIKGAFMTRRTTFVVKGVKAKIELFIEHLAKRK